MRVVAGNYRSRQLKAPAGMQTRPTTDKVKGAIFNMIGPYFDGGIALDLYAGSGGLGIEALSRGMEKAYFVDKNFNAIKAVKSNIEQLKIEEKANILKKDANQALKLFASENLKFDLVLLDPPYKAQEIENQLEEMIKNNLLNNQAIIVCEIDKNVKINIPNELKVIKNQEYGITKIIICKFGE